MNHSCLSLIAGAPTGFDEIWIIGDTHLLAQARKSLENLKDTNAFNNKGEKAKIPYIIDNFEITVSAFHFSWCITTQIRGGLNHLLLTKWRLPNYIYILFSNDQVDESEVLGGELYKVLDSLFSYISRALLERKIALPKKARRFKPPSIIIVKTVAKSSENLEIDDFKIKRRTFNRALQKEALNRQWRSINIDSILPSDHRNFSNNGEDLSDEGFIKFWNFLSEDLREQEKPREATSKERQYKNKTTQLFSGNKIYRD